LSVPIIYKSFEFLLAICAGLSVGLFFGTPKPRWAMPYGVGSTFAELTKSYYVSLFDYGVTTIDDIIRSL
jgi:hypothetical protein